MRFKSTPEERQARTITGLVDGSLSEAERAAAEELAGQPEIRQQVASQRRVAHDLRTGGPAVPPRLVSAIEAQVQAAYGPDSKRHGGAWLRSQWRPAAAVAAVAAVCAVVLVAIGIGGGGPSITAAAKLARAPATGPAPAAMNAKLLDVSYAGVTYPNYLANFAAPPTGRRTDRIGGRPAMTVFYRLRNGARLSYTVFSGGPVPLPRGTRLVMFEGHRLRVFSTSDGLAVVTLVRFGRTCVLAARTSRAVVLALAEAPVRHLAAA